MGGCVDRSLKPIIWYVNLLSCAYKTFDTIISWYINLKHTQPHWRVLIERNSLSVDDNIYIYICIYIYKLRMVRETRVQSQVESYQRLKKWYLVPPCLTLSIIRYVSRGKWNNPRKEVASSLTFDGEAPVLDIWGSPSLPLLPGSFWSAMAAPDRFLPMGQIELFDHLNCG